MVLHELRAEFFNNFFWIGDGLLFVFIQEDVFDVRRFAFEVGVLTDHIEGASIVAYLLKPSLIEFAEVVSQRIMIPT